MTTFTFPVSAFISCLFLFLSFIEHPEQYLARFEPGINGFPHIVQCFLFSLPISSANSSSSCDSTACRNHLQQTEYDRHCAHLQFRAIHSPSMQLQQVLRISEHTLLCCAGVILGKAPFLSLSILGNTASIFIPPFSFNMHYLFAFSLNR